MYSRLTRKIIRLYILKKHNLYYLHIMIINNITCLWSPIIQSLFLSTVSKEMPRFLKSSLASNICWNKKNKNNLTTVESKLDCRWIFCFKREMICCLNIRDKYLKYWMWVVYIIDKVGRWRTNSQNEGHSRHLTLMNFSTNNQHTPFHCQKTSLLST